MIEGELQVRLLLEWGADIISEIEDDEDDDALEAAVEAGHDDLVQMLSSSSICLLSNERLDNCVRCVINNIIRVKKG